MLLGADAIAPLDRTATSATRVNLERGLVTDSCTTRVLAWNHLIAKGVSVRSEDTALVGI